MKLQSILAAILFVGLTSLGSNPVAAPAGEIVVIVNKANSMAQLSSKDVKLIFTGKNKKWSDGQKVFPINLPHGSEYRTLFDKSVLNYSPSEIKEYWVQQRIKAKGSPPAVLNSSIGVKRLVSKLPPAIGYIPVAEVDDSVKVVFKFAAGK